MPQPANDFSISEHLFEVRSEAISETIELLAQQAKDDVPEQGDLETEFAEMVLAQEFDYMPEPKRSRLYRLLGHGIVRVQELTGWGDN